MLEDTHIMDCVILTAQLDQFLILPTTHAQPAIHHAKPVFNIQANAYHASQAYSCSKTPADHPVLSVLSTTTVSVNIVISIVLLVLVQNQSVPPVHQINLCFKEIVIQPAQLL